MTVHECTRCGYKTKNACDFKKHLQRKKVCEPKVADVSLEELKKRYLTPKATLIDCPKCYKGFSSSYGFKLHVQKCSGTLDTVASLPETSASSEISEVKEMLSQVKQLLATTLSAAGQSTNNVVNQVNNIVEKAESTVNHVENINITINNFGAEPICHLLEDVDFMKSCFQNYEHGLIDFIIRKWFDPNHPENHCLEPFLGGMVKCYEHGRWCAKPVNERFLDSVMNHVGSDYQSFLERNPVFEKRFLDEFMKKIGVPLEWDLDHGGYIFEAMSLDQKAKVCREQLHRLVSKQVFRS